MKTLTCSLLVAALATIACRRNDGATPPGPLAAPPTAPHLEPAPVAEPTTEPPPDASLSGTGAPACDGSATDRCISPTCGDLSRDFTACKVDSDCTIDTFATCECASAGPFYSVAKSHAADVKKTFASSRTGECDCGCPGFAPACVEGTCGFAPP